MRLVMLHNLIRTDEKLLLDAARKMNVGLETVSMKGYSLSVQEGKPVWEAALDRGISHFQSLCLLRMLEDESKTFWE